MPRSSRPRRAPRTDARRRGRLAARGEPLDEQLDEAEEPSSRAGEHPARGGLLTSIFPPAPPLPGKGDPLAGFTYSGPLRGVVANAWILHKQPAAWLGMGALWLAARFVTFADPERGSGLIAIVSSFTSFGAVVAAGWFGWRRPWLYGLAAAVTGVLGFATCIGILVSDPGIGEDGVEFFLRALLSESFQILFGILGGAYGGYFRRRVVSQRPPARGQRRKR